MMERARFLEPVVNREASTYITDNYDTIVSQIAKMGIHEDKVFDLLHDVYYSIVQAEDEGNGYDMSKAKTDDLILVAHFVYGRIKGYTKNSRYRTDVTESYTKKSKYETETDKKTIKLNVVASSSGGQDFDTMDSFQKAYATASSFDDIIGVEDEMSVRENIEFCLGFDSIIDMSMLALLRNIDVLANCEIHKSLFDSLKYALKIHDEFAEAFKSIIEYSMKNRSSFDKIVESF